MTRRLRSGQFPGEPGDSFEGVEPCARCAQTYQPEDRGCTREKRWPLPSAEVATCEKQGSEQTMMRRKWEGMTVGTGQARPEDGDRAVCLEFWSLDLFVLP